MQPMYVSNSLLYKTQHKLCSPIELVSRNQGYSTSNWEDCTFPTLVHVLHFTSFLQKQPVSQIKEGFVELLPSSSTTIISTGLALLSAGRFWNFFLICNMPSSPCNILTTCIIIRHQPIRFTCKYLAYQNKGNLSMRTRQILQMAGRYS